GVRLARYESGWSGRGAGAVRSPARRAAGLAAQARRFMAALRDVFVVAAREDVGRLAGGKLQDAVRERAQEGAIVGNEEQRAFELREGSYQHVLGVDIQV